MLLTCLLFVPESFGALWTQAAIAVDQARCGSFRFLLRWALQGMNLSFYCTLVWIVDHIVVVLLHHIIIMKPKWNSLITTRCMSTCTIAPALVNPVCRCCRRLCSHLNRKGTGQAYGMSTVSYSWLVRWRGKYFEGLWLYSQGVRKSDHEIRSRSSLLCSPVVVQKRNVRDFSLQLFKHQIDSSSSYVVSKTQSLLWVPLVSREVHKACQNNQILLQLRYKHCLVHLRARPQSWWSLWIQTAKL